MQAPAGCPDKSCCRDFGSGVKAPDDLGQAFALDYGDVSHADHGITPQKIWQ